MMQFVWQRLRRWQVWGVLGMLFLYRVLLDVMYWQGNRLFASYLEDVHMAPWGLFILSYLLMAAIVLLGPGTLERPSQYMFFIFLVLVYVPVTSVFGMITADVWGWLLLTAGFFVYALFVDRGWVRFRLPSVQPRYADAGLLALLLLFLGLLLMKFGLKGNLPSLLRIYDVRAEYKEKSARWSRYLVSWTMNVLAPWALLRGMEKRSVLLALLALAAEIYIYMIAGFKTALFAPLFVGIVYLLVAKYLRLFQMLFLGAVNTMFLVLVVGNMFHLRPFRIASSIFAVRMFVTPGVLFWRYVTFAQENALDFFAQHFPFELFLESHYARPLPYVIAEYFGFSGVYSNANLFADAIVNLGYWGIPVMAGLVLALSVIVDAVAYGKSRAMVYALLSMPLFAMVNTSFLTALLSHGFLFALLVIYLLPQQHNNAQPTSAS